MICTPSCNFFIYDAAAGTSFYDDCNLISSLTMMMFEPVRFEFLATAEAGYHFHLRFLLAVGRSIVLIFCRTEKTP